MTDEAARRSALPSLLEEIGKPYEAEKMDVAGGATEEIGSGPSTLKARCRL